MRMKRSFKIIPVLLVVVIMLSSTAFCRANKGNGRE